jgi:hypothetical protein
MQALKALVIFMGVLIAVGVAVLGVTIYNRATKMVTDDKPAPAVTSLPPLAGAPATQSGSDAQTSPPLQAPSGAATNFGVRELGLPAGSTVVSVQPLASRVLVHARLPDGGTRILLLDPATGDVAGEWRASGAPGSQSPAQAPPAEGSGRP